MPSAPHMFAPSPDGQGKGSQGHGLGKKDSKKADGIAEGLTVAIEVLPMQLIHHSCQLLHGDGKCTLCDSGCMCRCVSRAGRA